MAFSLVVTDPPTFLGGVQCFALTEVSNVSDTNESKENAFIFHSNYVFLSLAEWRFGRCFRKS